MKRIKFILLLAILSLLVGCKAPRVEPITSVEEPKIIEKTEDDKILSLEEQEVIIKEYYELLKSGSDNIITFIDEGMSKLDKINVDNIIISLEDHLKLNNPSISEISSKLNKYYNYSTDEIKSYLDILSVEGQMMFTDGEDIKVSLDELLERARNAETHLKEYSGGLTYNKVYDLYENYIIGAILGSGNQFVYAKEGYSTIREDVLNKYKNYIENYKNSAISDILSQYLDELELDEMDMNGVNVLKFYDDIRDIIKYNSNKVAS